MFVILFKSRLSEHAGADYYATEDRMRERVREIAGTDLVEVKHYTGEDGDRLAVVMWENAGTLEEWRTDPEHQVAQKLGRDRWYSAYELTVAEVVRTSSHETGPVAAEAGEPDGKPR
ncbi:antibiotic biosynthesis monooxygenase [Streptomyces sp. p1417]|uniref:Antibiotic biosynthesis monooxygenase n=1 Tax=Streptomyces typhae TaxID=2681492 RepID=A0A6L6X5S6_9ACTN|nr:antibiotic biosynthesis monooxygenase [Streptomyces typhae]MVO89224.1 antibiotic biosynthesis monooxygenase [Streptomyces typhae]